MKNRIGLTTLIIILIAVSIGAFALWRHRIKTQGEMYFYEAKKLYKDKKYEESFLAFDALLKRYKRALWHGEAVYYAAKNLSTLGRDKEAIEYWQRIKQRYADRLHADETNFYIGKDYETKGDLEQARLHYENVIKDFPASSFVDDALSGLGRIYGKEGKVEESVATFEKIATNFPGGEKVAEALLGIAQFYEKEGEWMKSLGLYHRVRRDSQEKELVERAEEGIGRVNIRIIFSRYSAEDSFIYKVEEGDTLSAIADKFNTPVDLIMEINSLKNTMLMPGQRLKIIRSNFSIEINKAENKLYLKNNGKIIKVYRAATGENDSTPEGAFTIVNKLKDPTWYSSGAIIPPGSPENILGSRWLGLSEKGYGIHGTANPADIGKYVTNGCVRLLESDVEEIYKLVPVGTKVIISGNPPVASGK